MITANSKNVRDKSALGVFDTEDVRGELYVCPNNCRARVVLLFVSNANGNTTVKIEWYRVADSQHYYIISGKNLGTGEFLQFSDSYIVLEPGDKIEITPSANATPNIHAFCTVEEVFIPVG